MRFIREFERVPTETLVTFAGALRSLENRTSLDDEQLIDISAVVTRRVEKKLTKEENNPAGDDSYKNDEEDAKALVEELRADIDRQAESL